MRTRMVHSISLRAGCAAALILTIVALAAAPTATAQAVDVAARWIDGSVVLRWTPGNAAMWRAGLEHGYRVVRTGGGASESVVTAWPEAKWRASADAGNALARTVIAIVHDTATSTPARPDEGGLVFDGTLEDARYGTAMLMAASDPATAEGLGLRFVDRTALPGVPYVYCVSVNLPAREADRGCAPLEISPVKAATIAPHSLEATVVDGTVILTWLSAKSPDLLGFHVDRIDEKTSESRRLTTAPILVSELPDSVEEHSGMLEDVKALDGGSYRYEVRSIDGFGELSAPATVSVRVRTPRPLPNASEPRVRQLGQCETEVTWESGPMGDPALCVRIEKADRLFGEYRQLEVVCGAERTSIIDNAASGKTPYYRIVIVDDSGRESVSEAVRVVFADSTAPAAPLGLTGSIDEAGMVTLHWSAGVECDVRGYHVFWANDPTHEFAPRTRAIRPETTFSDTVNIETLTRRVYYRIVAVDYAGNTSRFSSVLELERPDHLRPLPPVLIDAASADGRVTLRWQRSPSADVAKQHVQRRTETDREWKTIATQPAEALEYSDASVRPAGEYAYQLFVEDSAGNRSSMAGPLSVRVRGVPRPATVVALDGSFESATRSAQLVWKVSAALEPDAWFIILRSAPGGRLEAIATARSHERTFVDDDLRVSGEYTYALQIARGQKRSEISEPVTVAVP